MSVQTITNPKEQKVNIVVESGQTIAFDFTLDTASFERSGNDLAISLDDGGQIILGDFFVASDISSLPSLQLADGTEVNSGDFLSAFELDITPAAGGSPAGGGLNAYSDGAGNLVAGLGLSESQGTFYWNSANAQTEELDGLAAPLGGGATPPAGVQYNARAVLYESNPLNYGSSQLTFNVNLPGSAAGSSVTILSSANGYVDLGTLNWNITTGSYEFTVSDAALDKMKGSRNQLYDYVTLSDGTVIQVVLNQSGQFNSAAEDTANPPGAPMQGEWHTQNSCTYDINSSTSAGARGDEVWLKGMTGSAGQHNLINTHAGADVVKIASGVFSSTSGSNTINTGKDAGDKITLGANLQAGNAGKNTLTSETIDINAINGRGAVLADGGANALDASGTIDISAAGQTGEMAAGVNAFFNGQAGENIINSDNGSVKVNAVSLGGDGLGVTAGKASSNTISAGKAVEINVNATSAGGIQAYGVESFTGGKNTICAGTTADIKVAADDAANEAAGLVADGGVNAVTAVTAANITVEGNGVCLAAGVMTVEGSNTVKVTGGALNISVDNNGGTNYGMKAGEGNAQNSDYEARNELEASGDVKISVQGFSSAVYGMDAINTASGGQYGNIINAGGDVIINAGDAQAMQAHGMQALDNGRNEINAITGKAVITANAKFNAGGMEAGERYQTGGAASNTINAAEVELHASSDQKFARGMHAWASGSNSIDASISAQIEAKSANSGAFGLLADGEDANNTVKVTGVSGDVSASIEASGSHDSEDVVALLAKSGLNSVTAVMGGIDLTAGNAFGLAAALRAGDSGNSGYKAVNQVIAQDGDISVNVDGLVAYGMQAGGSHASNPSYQARNELDALEGDVSINVDGTSATGMHSQNLSLDSLGSVRQYGNFISAPAGNVNISSGGVSSGLAYGMVAIDSGYNSITANGAVDVSSSGKYGATGMQALEQNTTGTTATNIISGSHVSVEAQTELGKAYAMLARAGGENHIEGVLGQGYNQVAITLTGSSISGKGFAMYAEGNGLNMITLKDGGIVNVNGDVGGGANGRNEIYGSTENDAFVLDGGVDVLFIDGGTAGYDTLVLMASNLIEFNSRYETWLAGSSNVANIDAVDVRYYGGINVSMDDFSTLENMLKTAFGSNADIIYSLGDGDNILQASSDFQFGNDFHLAGGLGHDTLDLGVVANGNFTLDQMAGVIDGFEHLNLGSGVVLTIDSLLGGLNIDGKLAGSPYEDGTALLISGDGSGQVLIGPGSGWSHDGSTTHTYDSVVYDVYTNDQQTAQYLLIQCGLV